MSAEKEHQIRLTKCKRRPRAFICQISEEDWLVSREIGVYGNREGTERKGKMQYFDSGSPTVQSIIEDLIGMRKGDLIFFHVIEKTEGESSLHGVYMVREEPFYNDKVRLWKSNPKLIYPYRFCFEPHPEHLELCRYDANIPVSEFYMAIENRDIRSIFTLEREVRGGAHAVKTITYEDAEVIIKLLYRDFQHRRLQRPINFRPVQMDMSPLKNYIKRIGEIEFAIKALIAYKLGRGAPNFIRFIPACRSGEYEFLIQTFVGATMRRPVDILCIGKTGSKKIVTTIEVKKDLARIDDLVQLFKYSEIFRMRNIDIGSLTYDFSSCLIARRFQSELINYVSVRNTLVPWEEVILLRYTPTSNGRDATFAIQALPRTLFLPSKIYPKVKGDVSQACIDPKGFYSALGKKILPNIDIEFQSSEENVTILRKYYLHNNQRVFLNNILVYVINGKCDAKEFIKFMNYLRKETEKFRGDFMAVEPIIIAKDYDNLIGFFIEQYNKYETEVRRQRISAYIKA